MCMPRGLYSFLIVVLRLRLLFRFQFRNGGTDFGLVRNRLHLAGIERRQLWLRFAQFAQERPAAFEIVPMNIRRPFPSGPAVGVQGTGPSLFATQVFTENSQRP